MMPEMQQHLVTSEEVIVPIAFDLVEVIRLLWRSKKKILTFMLLGFFLALGMAFAVTPTFSAQGELVVRAEATNSPDAERAFYTTAVNEAVVATERSILTASGLLKQTALHVQFPSVMLRPSWISAQVIKIRGVLAEHGIGSKPPELTDFEEDARRFNLLRAAISTRTEKDSSVIFVSASTPNPEFSAAVVNDLLDNYMRERVLSQQTSARNVEASLKDRLRQVSNQMQDTQDRIADMMRQPNLVEGSEIAQNERSITILSGQLSKARLDLVGRQAAYEAAVRLQNDAHGDPARLAELLDSGTQSSSDLRRLFAQKQQELAGLSSQLGPAYPHRSAVQNEIGSLSTRLTGEAARIVAQRKSDLDASTRILADLTSQFDTVRSGAMHDAGAGLLLSRERDKLANLQRLSGTIEDRLVAVVSQPVDPNARILSRAGVPVVANFPDKPLFTVIGSIIGALGSSSVIVILGLVSKLRPSVTRVARMLPGPMLGAIPLLNRVCYRNEGLINVIRKIQFDGVQNLKNQQINAAFQGVALELDYELNRTSARVVAVASALAQEGKSTTAAALGLQLARLGRNVMLIQCDLHSGRTNYFSKRGDDLGFGGAGQALSELYRDPEWTFSVMELPVVQNPMEFLCSKEFSNLLRRVRNDYDIVLCDMPPALAVPDSLLVTRIADAVLLVHEFRRNVVGHEAAELSRRISTTSTPICGVVITKVETDDMKYSAYLGYRPAGRRRLLS